jgi:uncharacterized membrane protein
MAGFLVLMPLLVTVSVLVLLFQYFNTLGLGIYIDRLYERLTGHRLTGLGFFVIVLLMLGAGVAASTVVGSKLFQYGESFIVRIPIARVVYTSTQQILDFFLSNKSKQFGRVVMVEYPRAGMWVIGFQTGHAPPPAQVAEGQNLVSVFMPFTPPASGIVLWVPEEEVVPIDMPVEEAFRLIISGGALVSEAPTQSLTEVESSGDSEPRASASEFSNARSRSQR